MMGVTTNARRIAKGSTRYGERETVTKVMRVTMNGVDCTNAANARDI
jgi:hypothetical protein